MTHLQQTGSVLWYFSIAMALALLPTWLWSWLDKRTIRGVEVWRKPFKFMLSTAVFGGTTLWLMAISGASPAALPVFNSIGILMACVGSIEVAYITVQAIRGQPSHYHVSQPLYAALYALMGIAAIALTGSQLWLAWVIVQDPNTSLASVSTQGIVWGLVLTFVLGTVSGGVLGGKQPPDGKGGPVFGWRRRQDLRPAHFVGLHAQQVIPVFALTANQFLGSWASAGLLLFTAAYVTLWAALMWLGIGYRPRTAVQANA